MGYIAGGFYTGAFTAAELREGKGAGLGDRAIRHDGTEWLFVTFGGAIGSAGQVVIIDEAYSAVLLSTSNDARGDLVGVVNYAANSGEFGWVQVKGPCILQVNGLCVANARLNTTGTAGQLDDDGTGGAMQVQGVYLTVTQGAGAGTGPAILNYPFVDVTL